MGLLKSINAQFVTGIMALALLALLAWTFAGWLTYSEPVNFSPDIGVENGDGTYTLPDGTIFLPDQPKAYTYQPAAPLNTERSVGVEHEYLPSGKYSDYPDAGYIDTYSDYIGYGYTRKDVCGKNDCTLHIPAYDSTYTPPFDSTYTPSSARVNFRFFAFLAALLFLLIATGPRDILAKQQQAIEAAKERYASASLELHDVSGRQRPLLLLTISATFVLTWLLISTGLDGLVGWISRHR